METMAVLQALQQHPGEVEIYSDSAYVVNCFLNSWWKGWEAKGWKNAKGAAVANQDIWRPLIALYKAREGVTFKKVKGHSGVPLNERADQLANEQAAIASKMVDPRKGQSTLF
jgi:ribonuclease HI